MVKKLSHAEKQAIDKAVKTVEASTCAQVLIVVAHASDAYETYILLFGLLLGSISALAFWAEGVIHNFPALLIVQLGFMLLIGKVPCLAQWCIGLVPVRVKRHKAALRAFSEYHHARHHVPPQAPLVLLYVSLAERYVHVLQSRVITEIVPKPFWDAQVTAFSTTMQQSGLQTACEEFALAAGKALAPHFPPAGGMAHSNTILREI